MAKSMYVHKLYKEREDGICILFEAQHVFKQYGTISRIENTST